MFTEVYYFECAILPSDSGVSNELLVTIGTDALDWLLGGGTNLRLTGF